MICPYCGAEISDEAEFCPICEKEILEEDTDANMTPEQKKKQLVVSYIYLIGTILALAGVFYALATWVRNNV